MEHRLSELKLKLRQCMEHTTEGPWVRSGVRAAFPQGSKATWIGPDGPHIIGVMFSDLTPEEYKASMAEAEWVFLTQPENIRLLLDALDQSGPQQ